MRIFESIKNNFNQSEYRLEGECLKCGRCCKEIYSLDDYTTFDFKMTQLIFPQYKRLNVAGKDENGNIILQCNWLKEDGTCCDYNNRLDICRKFPNVKYGSLGKVPEGCGYRLVPVKKFGDVLQNTANNDLFSEIRRFKYTLDNNFRDFLTLKSN